MPLPVQLTNVPAPVNLEVDRGTTPTYKLSAYQVAPGNPVVLTGTTLVFLVKRATTDADAAALVRLDTAGGGVVITDGPNGLYQVTLPASATQQTDPYGRYVLVAGLAYPWSIKLTQPGSPPVATVLEQGTLVVRDSAAQG